jgi:ribosome-associated heat shock protein Hsp15
MPPGAEDPGWQRLDSWLWCARVGRTRTTCAKLVEEGSFRVNRQPTDKPHARVRVGDVLTFALGHGGQVRVWRVLALAERRGPASEARLLYADLSADRPEADAAQA